MKKLELYGWITWDCLLLGTAIIMLQYPFDRIFNEWGVLSMIVIIATTMIATTYRILDKSERLRQLLKSERVIGE